MKVFSSSHSSGVLWISGSIIEYPILLHILPLLGFAAFFAHEVVGIIAIQVFLKRLVVAGLTGKAVE